MYMKLAGYMTQAEVKIYLSLEVCFPYIMVCICIFIGGKKMWKIKFVVKKYIRIYAFSLLQILYKIWYGYLDPLWLTWITQEYS